MPTLRNIPQPGLGWEYYRYQSDPIFTIESSIDVIKKLTILHMSVTGDCHVAEIESISDCSKWYHVKCDQGVFTFKVCLPLAPKVRTLSEVATISFIENNTTIPAPKVMAYDANLNNELGFEWILFKHASGHSLLDRWHEMSWLKKELIVRKIMDYMVQLSRIELSGIGSMFRYSLSSGNSEGFHHKIGEYVAAYFFRNEHIQLEIPRGPYTTSSEWLAAHMEFISHNITMWHESGGDDRGLAVEAQKIFEGLQRVLLKFFPSFDSEPTFLDQHRFDEYNILVDDSGDLVCILDWSSINAVPHWEAYQIPRLLYSTCVKYIPEPPTEEDKQNEEFYEEYKYKIQNYETWRLRTFFLEEMQRIAPEWVRTFKKETIKRDILTAIECLDHSFHTTRVQRWLNCVLEDRIPQKPLTDAVSFPWLRDYADDMPCERHVKVEDPDEEVT